MGQGRLVRLLLRVTKPLWKIRRLALLSEEIFWSRWLRQHRVQVHEALAPNRPFPADLSACIEQLDRDPVDVLEVGAGPFGSIGSWHPTRTIRMTATDILAPQYDRMLARQKIEPAIRTIYADAERLVQQFGAGAFDLVYATNCVDHMERPLAALYEMVAVTRPGGWIVLYHEVDEGARQDYAGLHQWNLNAAGGHFIVWNERERHDVTQLLRGVCDVTTELRDGDKVYVTMRKLTSGPAPAR